MRCMASCRFDIPCLTFPSPPLSQPHHAARLANLRWDGAAVGHCNRRAKLTADLVDDRPHLHGNRGTAG